MRAGGLRTVRARGPRTCPRTGPRTGPRTQKARVSSAGLRHVLGR